MVLYKEKKIAERRKTLEQEIKISYQIYIEADDINASRIQSTISFVKNLFENCENVYLKEPEFEDESDLEEFSLRFYVSNEILEFGSSNPNDKDCFLEDMMEFVDTIAQAQSYANIEGQFSITENGEKQSYCFTSEEGDDYCDIIQQ